MNRKEFYARRRVYRILTGQDNDEYNSYPSQDSGKYWSGMGRFVPNNPYMRDYINSAKQVHNAFMYHVRSGRMTKEEFMFTVPDRFKKRHPKVKLP